MTQSLSLNRVVFSRVIEARDFTSFRMYEGQICRIEDIEGKQVADLVCFDAEDTADKLSVNNTVLMNRKWRVSVGDVLFSTRATQLMTIVADSCGVHDLVAGSCSEGTNRARYGVRGTANCRENFEAALQPFNVTLNEIPYSFNIFMNVPISEESVVIEEPVSVAGDFVELRAERDVVVAISNCPQERNPCNGFTPTSLRVSVREDSSA